MNLTWKPYVPLTGCSSVFPERATPFAISGKLGLPEPIIEDAKNRLTEQDESFEDLLSDLEHSRVTIEKEEEELARYKEEITALKSQLEQKTEKLNDCQRADSS